MKEIIEILSNKINVHGELHLNDDQTKILLDVLRNVDRLLDEHKVFLEKVMEWKS